MAATGCPRDRSVIIRHRTAERTPVGQLGRQFGDRARTVAAAEVKADPTMTASANAAIWAAWAPVRTPSPTPIGRLGQLPASGHQCRRGGRDLVPRPGDAHGRRRVEEAAGCGCGQTDPLGRGRGRDQEDRIDAVGAGRGQPRLRLVDDQVRGDHPGTAGRGQIPGEVLDAVGQDRVEVRHHDRPTAGRRHPLHDGEGVAEPKPVAAGRFRRGLDHRSVEHRVGERHADLDQVAAAVDHRGQGGGRRVDGRETGGQVADQRGPTLGPGTGEQVRQRAHQFPSGAGAAISSTSAMAWRGAHRRAGRRARTSSSRSPCPCRPARRR